MTSHTAGAPGNNDATRWYGWQTLIADGASLAIGMTGGVMDLNRTSTASHTLLYTGLVGYALGPLAIHWGHGRVVTGFESLGLRVGLPVASAFVATALGPKCDGGPEGDGGPGRTACIPYAFGGVVVGLVAAVVIDTALLAREPVAPTTGAPAPTGSFSIAPIIVGSQRGVILRAAF